MNNRRLILGVLLLWWGGSSLMGNLGWIEWQKQIDWSIFWPVAMIFAGVAILEKKGISGIVLESGIIILTVVLTILRIIQ